MISKYSKIKMKTPEFKSNWDFILNDSQGKKVLLYGAGELFETIIDFYSVLDMDLVGIADKKFTDEETYFNLKTIKINELKNVEYDAILLTLEQSEPIEFYFRNTIKINEKIKFYHFFKETIKGEKEHLNFLENHKFSKQLLKIKEDFADKKIAIFGTDSFFDCVAKYYDLSGLNIVGISDKKLNLKDKKKSFFNYSFYYLEELPELKPDVLFVAKRFPCDDVDYFRTAQKFKNIQVEPLVKVSQLEHFKELFNV